MRLYKQKLFPMNLRKVSPYRKKRLPCGNFPCQRHINQACGMDIGDSYFYFCSVICKQEFKAKRTDGAAERVAAFKKKMEERNVKT